MSCVLIVDDDESVRFLMTQILSVISSIDCAVAADTAETLELIRERRVDALVIDSILDRERGIDVYRAAVGIDPSLAGRALFTSGMNLDEATKKQLTAEGLRFICKPFDLCRFVGEVEQLLGRRGLMRR